MLCFVLTIYWVKTNQKNQITTVALCSFIETNSFYIAALCLFFIMGEPHLPNFGRSQSHQPGKWEPRNLHRSSLFFHKKWYLKPQNFEILLGSKMNGEWVCFFIYLYHTNHLLENGNHETCISQHIFVHKMRVQTAKIRIFACND